MKKELAWHLVQKEDTTSFLSTSQQDAQRQDITANHQNNNVSLILGQCITLYS